MSHIATYTTSLQGVNHDLLANALAIVAAENDGGTVGTSILNWNRQTLKHWDGVRIIGSIQSRSVPRGIGLIEKNGGLQFIGDSYGHGAAFEKLRSEIEETYIKLAVGQALAQCGYVVDMQSVEGEGVVFQGAKQ